MARAVVGYLFLVMPVLAGWAGMVDPNDRGPRRVIMALNGAVAFFALLTYLRYRGRGAALGTPVTRAAGMFFAYLLVITLWLGQTIRGVGSVDQMGGLLALLAWLLPAVALLLVPPRWRDLPAIRRLVTLGLLGVSASVYVNAGAALLGRSFGETLAYKTGMERYFGPLGDQVGFIVLLGVFIALVERAWLRLAIHLVALVLTGTRGAVITMVAGMLVYVVTTVGGGDKLRRSRSWASMAVFGAVLVAALASSVGEATLARFLDPARLETGVSTRSASMQLGLEAVQLNPVFGAGFNGFTRLAYDLRAEGLFHRFIAVYVSNASNQYVQTAVEGGLVGLFLLGRFLWLLLRAAWAVRRRVPDGERGLFEGAFLWIAAMVIGDQGAVWLLPGFLPCVYVFALGALMAGQVAQEVPAESAPAPGLLAAGYAR